MFKTPDRSALYHEILSSATEENIQQKWKEIQYIGRKDLQDVDAEITRYFDAKKRKTHL